MALHRKNPELISSFGFLMVLIGGIPQLVAIAYGINEWFGINFFLCLFIGLFVTYIPVLGAVAGFLGAIIGLEWNVYSAMLLCFLNMLGNILAFNTPLKSLFVMHKKSSS